MKRVVVIGGGVAGIASSVILSEQGIAPIVVERGGHLGGRASSFFFPRMGEEIDYGKHVIMKCCTHSIRLLELLGQKGAVLFQPRLNVTLSKARKKVKIESYPFPGVLHILPSLSFYGFLSLPERIQVAQAGLSLLLKDPGEISFGKWLSCHKQSPRAINTLWDPICVSTLNAHAGDVGARQAQFMFNESFFRPHGADIGFFIKPLSRIFASAIPFIEKRQGQALLGLAAQRIIVDKGRILGVELSNGDIINSAAVIVAVSYPDLHRLLTRSGLEYLFPAQLSQIRSSPIVDVHLWFDRKVMEDLFVIGIGNMQQAIFNVSAAGDDREKYHISISHSASNMLIDLPVEDIMNKALASMKEHIPLAGKAKLIDWLVIKSRHATFIPAPGTENLRPHNVTSIEGLFLAGDYTATGWPSTIEGAARSGISAAHEVMKHHSLN
jgi:squalene-associated FAD-dependent desaturase